MNSQKGSSIRRVLIVGGAGFIGSHLCDRLLASSDIDRLRIFDNFSSGKAWHIEPFLPDRRFNVVRGEATDLPALADAMSGYDTVIHLASNPDIARAMTDPSIDFEQGTLLTHNVLEAMRRSGVQRILYASGSGVYGDLGELEVDESHGPLLPVSTYGASKLAGEALICSYAHMFGIEGRAFRFGNVVGPRQTHGVGFDFVRRLAKDPTRLSVLGDGSQSKSYIHVDDVIGAVLLAAETVEGPFQVFNVATGDYVTVSEIARLAIEEMGLNLGAVSVEFGTEPRGWKGDVPIVRLDTSRIRGLGWQNRLGSLGALRAALRALIEDPRTSNSA